MPTSIHRRWHADPMKPFEVGSPGEGRTTNIRLRWRDMTLSMRTGKCSNVLAPPSTPREPTTMTSPQPTRHHLTSPIPGATAAQPSLSRSRISIMASSLSELILCLIPFLPISPNTVRTGIILARMPMESTNVDLSLFPRCVFTFRPSASPGQQSSGPLPQECSGPMRGICVWA